MLRCRSTHAPQAGLGVERLAKKGVQAMEAIWRNIGKFTTYIGKVLLPVLLSSLVFGGILAKYLNEMNLNKSSLESAYQSMKKQHLECIGAQNRFRGKLTVIRASVHGLQESIQLGVAPPEPFWKSGPGDSLL